MKTSPQAARSGYRRLPGLLAGAFVALISVPARATTFVVTTTADGNNGACTVSLCTLRDAVIAANSNAGADVITLPAGTYTLTIAGANEDNAATGDLDIKGDLTINGAGSATTIIDGGALDRVFDIIGSVTVALNNLTVRNGLNNNGGGIQIPGPAAATVTITGCAVSGNHGTISDGVGIYNNNAALTIANSTISGNTGTSIDGGGIYNDGTATLMITNSTISGNGGAITDGSGIYNNATLTIISSTISANVGTNTDGGGIYNNSSLTITDSTVSGNTAGANGDGGGIYNEDTATITNCTISGNTANEGGGIFSNGTLTISNSTISGNSGSGAGGGLEDNNGATITSTTIANNSSCAGCGGGIGANQLTSLKNTIVANNTGGNCSSTVINGGTNLQFPGTTCGAGITSADPVLGALADNGGPTQTHALSASSTAAIDQATTGCPPPATDQRGISRPQSSACDIGSFELQGVPATSTPTNTPAGVATATPTNTPTNTPTTVPATATRTATPIAGVVVPTLSFPMLALLALALGGAALLILKR